jgi:teichuronic acid biosynthesis glycosyltransferase TuaH
MASMQDTAGPDGNERPNVLILGTAEWDAAIATNQHYVARELASVVNLTFVESLGLRRPTLRKDDVSRMASRVRRAFADKPDDAPAHRPRPANTTIVSPLVLPVHRAPTYALNRSLLRKATADWLASPRPRVLWAFTPVTYGLEESADVVIYHCVDLLGKFPGVDAVAVDEGERRLSTRVSTAIATSKPVEEHLAAAGFPRITLLPNVADTSVFAHASRPSEERRPSVLFSGNLTVHKLDVALLERIATVIRGHGELLLAGPLAAGGGGFGPELARLETLGARYLGLLTPDQLAEAAGQCTVGLIPYAINDYTTGVSPLKAFEYLSSGLAVLATPLPSVRALAETNSHVVVAEAETLADQVIGLLKPATDDVIDSRIDSAGQQGWGERGELLRELLASELRNRR